MTEEYKTIEQRVWDSTKYTREQIRDFGINFIKSFYGAIALPFRIPTIVRKFDEGQLYTQRIEDIQLAKDTICAGGVLGGITGGSIDITTLGLLGILATSGDNPTPAIITGTVLALTNIASGVYEVHRAAVSRSNLEKK